jgi:hypothetical protein
MYIVKIKGNKGTHSEYCQTKAIADQIWDWAYQAGYKVEYSGKPILVRTTAIYAMDDVVKYAGLPLE